MQLVDKNGTVVNNYEYDEWGNILTSKETVGNPFKYAGEVYDSETGLYYLRARYYDPQMGRFINEDSYEGQVNNPLSLNLYTYCFNNPIIYVDPTGHYWKKSDSKFSSTVQAELLKLTLAWNLADSDKERKNIDKRQNEIRKKMSSGFGGFLDKAKTISGAAADEFSWFLCGDVSKAERDYWLTQVHKYDSSISVSQKSVLKGSMFIIGILAPSPDDAVKMISDKALKEMNKKVDKTVAKKFFKSLTKYAGESGENGIKHLSGNGIGGYMWECKVVGAGGAYRLLGNINDEGEIVWEVFKKTHK